MRQRESEREYIDIEKRRKRDSRKNIKKTKEQEILTARKSERVLIFIDVWFCENV